MKFLCTGDIHLTDRPRDEYRWSVFEWLRKRAESKAVDAIFILGDLTDSKDQHSGHLVNRIVNELYETNKIAPTWVAKGNHDYDADPETPFFKFWPNFIVNPTVLEIKGKSFFVYPHSRHFENNCPGFKAGHDFIFVHQTFAGAVASNGFALEGGTSPRVLGPKIVGEKCLVMSGDIHVPQQIGNITYAGAPHPVTFGDSYQPRVLYYDGEQLLSIKRTTIKKAAIEITNIGDMAEVGLTEGDQVRVTYILPRRDFPSWNEHREAVKEYCEKNGIYLHACELKQAEDTTKKLTDKDPSGASRRIASHEELFHTFCEERNIDPVYRKFGEKLL